MSLVSGSIGRPVTVSMATLAIVLLGAISLDRLGLNLLPELTYPTLTIRTDFEGAAPAEVEEQVTRRIEQRVGVVSGVRKMHSISTAGRSDVVLEFLWGTDMDLAAIEIREKLDLVRLPLEIERPSILRLNPNLDPIYRLALTRTEPLSDPVYDLQTLRRFGDEFLKRRLDPVPGVAAVVVSGGYEDEILVQVDQEKLSQLGITVEVLGQRLRNTNVNLSGGRLTDGGQEYLVRTLNQFESVDDIANTIIFERQGRILRLEDVALVQEGQKERDSIMRVNGREAIEIALYKEGDANTVSVAAEIGDDLEDIRETLPANFELTTIYNQATFINAAIREVQVAAAQGAVLAVLVLFLFLRDMRSTLIVTAVIPASVMATFALMYVESITLNVMSLGGIALAVGMLMDNAIVVLENISRHRHEGHAQIEAADRGATEVGGAVLASTLTTIAVFLPLAFVEGIAGQLFRDQALTVTFALTASLVLAFTLIPMLATVGAGSPLTVPEKEETSNTLTWWGRGARAIRLILVDVPRLILVAVMRAMRGIARLMSVALNPVLNGFDAAYNGLARAYDALLHKALAHRLLTVIIALATMGISAALLPFMALELIPPLSQGAFKVDLKLSPGARLEVTDRVLADVQEELLDEDTIEMTYSVAGTGGRLDASAVAGGENIGELNVVMVSEDPDEEQAVMSVVRSVMDDVPDARYTLERPQLFTLATPLEVEISGNDLHDIEAVANRLVALMRESTRFRDVESSLRPGYPEVQIRFDQERTAALGLTVPDVAQRVVRKIKGDVPTEYTWRDRKVDIRVRVDEDERDSEADIERMVVNPESDREVRLSTVADVTLGTGPADIQRIGQQRVAIVSANVQDDDLNAAAVEANRLLSEIPMPMGVSTRIGGQNEEMEASFRSLQFALLLALAMVYLVMASLFESLLHPFIIMFTVPLAGVGAVLALAVTNTPVSVVVFIGLILLVGIVVNNAIVLIDRVNGLRQEGYAKREALVAGANQRLRPILMTTLTTVLGLLPMAIGLGEAAELRTPMAITVIGGLLFSMLLTLVLIPVVYDLVDRKKMAGDGVGGEGEL